LDPLLDIVLYGRNADNCSVKPHFRKSLLLTFVLGAIAGQVRVGAGDSAQPIELIGWNADVVFENALAPTAASFDWPGPQQSDLPVRAWFEAGLEGHADGLPPSRRFSSAANTNVLFGKNPGDAGFALYQTEIDLTALNVHQKTIQSTTFKMGGTSVTVGIFAISGERSQSSDLRGTELDRK
jgi:hypothetical protein